MRRAREARELRSRAVPFSIVVPREKDDEELEEQAQLLSLLLERAHSSIQWLQMKSM